MAGRQGWNLKREHRTEHSAPSGPDHYAWKGDEARTSTKRHRCYRDHILADCAECGCPATDRHHIDGDTGNNRPENIRTLCRRCHMIEDGRLEAFIATARRTDWKVKPLKPCVVCKVPSRPMRVGRCTNCAMYFRNHGVERPEALHGGTGSRVRVLRNALDQEFNQGGGVLPGQKPTDG